MHEIDPEANVGTDIANDIAYPVSPRPEDVEETEKHKYFMGWGFTDIQVRGYYPKYFLNRFEGVDFDAIIQDGDLAFMREYINPGRDVRGGI